MNSPIRSSALSTVEEVFRPIVGKWAWHVRRGFGSFLTMEFGEPRLEVRDPRDLAEDVSDQVRRNFKKRRVTLVGEWHLWVQYCDWAILTPNSGVSNRETDAKKVDQCLEELDGQALVAVDDNAARASCLLHFDLGATLELSPSLDSDDNDLWTVHHLHNTVFGYRSNGTVVSEPAD